MDKEYIFILMAWKGNNNIPKYNERNCAMERISWIVCEKNQKQEQFIRNPRREMNHINIFTIMFLLQQL